MFQILEEIFQRSKARGFDHKAKQPTALRDLVLLYYFTTYILLL